MTVLGGYPVTLQMILQTPTRPDMRKMRQLPNGLEHFDGAIRQLHNRVQRGTGSRSMRTRLPSSRGVQRSSVIGSVAIAMHGECPHSSQGAVSVTPL